ncbi:MAG: heme-binding protein [Chloroflexi bacterium]|nr:heme-binding protein [Chloroflexota bacterium]
MYQATHLSHRDAAIIVDAIRAALEQQQRGGAIAVVDEHGELLAFLRTDGCPLASITIAINKAYTASRERKESAAVGRKAREEGFPMTNFGELRYVTWGGGVPVVYEGQVIGGVGVSGLSEDEDVALAHVGLTALLG